MWTTAIRSLSFNGSVVVDVGGGLHVPLKGVLVDVYRFSIGEDGNVFFERLNQVTERTSVTGDFSFNALPVSVEVQTVIPGSPPYTPVEITKPSSLPNLAFRISVEAEVKKAGSTESEGTQFVDIYDERIVIDNTWITSHPERLHVSLSGSPPIQLLIPEEWNTLAIQIAGITLPPVTVPGREFHFLRVGRVIREEIGELGDTRPEYIGKPGYMRSADTWTSTSSEPSFFGGVEDAPFGGTLHIGGQFGADLLTKDIYYTVSEWSYSGDPANPLSPGTQVQILDPLFNKRYILPTPALPKGKWETLNLGPFDATITAVEPPHDPGLVGTSVKVYKRPAIPNLLEYWPFWDLIVLWNSATAPNDLRVLSLEAYEKIGGSDANPELKKIAMTSSINDHLPLHIDNCAPVPKFLPFNPADPVRKFHTTTAYFLGVPETVVMPTTPMGICNEMSVQPGLPANGNECILVRYSVEDGSGNPHQHLSGYYLWAEFTPKAVAGAPDSAGIALKGSFSSYDPISKNYSYVSPPLMEVSNYHSVIVPAAPDGWPPEKGDTWALPDTCPQYAVEVGLTCWVRTIDGWNYLFDSRHVSRHIIIKRI